MAFSISRVVSEGLYSLAPFSSLAPIGTRKREERGDEGIGKEMEREYNSKNISRATTILGLPSSSQKG